jgi:hypothetical protein
MEIIMKFRTSLVNVLCIMLSGIALTMISVGCGDSGTEPDNTDEEMVSDRGGKADSGWLASDTYEVNAVVRSTVRQSSAGEWADLDKDEALQVKLVDTQLKFIKNMAESKGWRFNQLADSVSVREIILDIDGIFVIIYEAVVDMFGRLLYDGVFKFEELERKFDVLVP